VVKNAFLGIYRGWVIIYTGISILIACPIIVLPLLISSKFGAFAMKGTQVWTKIFTFFTQIHFEVSGEEKICPKRGRIYVFNHNSLLDTPAFASAIIEEFKPLVKKEILKVPVFKWIVAATCVTVDRDNAESRAKSIADLRDVLNRGISIVIAPEGTREKIEGPLNDFYSGAFRLAIETQAKIVPLVITNANQLLPSGTLRVLPGKVKIKILKEISAVGLQLEEDLLPLKEQTYQAMLNSLQAKN
jgi:1-acyl-sn-glycerol-3-phosphate acyltransferase